MADSLMDTVITVVDSDGCELSVFPDAECDGVVMFCRGAVVNVPAKPREDGLMVSVLRLVFFEVKSPPNISPPVKSPRSKIYTNLT